MTYKPETDLNHQYVSPEHRYACFNKPDSRVTRGIEQDGWTPDGRRHMVDRQTEWLPIGCGHTWRESDPSCTDCKWR